MPPAVIPAPANGGEDETVASGALQSPGANDVTVLSSGSRPGAILAPRLEPSQIFGPYRIESALGRGGMGEVFAAEHVEHARRVALKVLTARFAGAEERDRFLREGEIAASINHPHTVYVYGSEEIDGAPVIAMELLAGGTLRDRVQSRGPLAPAEAVDLILQVVSGLAAAETAGILHRDVKPANCFIDRDGVVKVGDFGLSISAEAGRRASGLFQGTPQFAPPEQIRGEPLDVRADIYSLGATLFYLLTGQPPFDDRDLTTLVTRVTVEAPRSPREMTAGVPESLGLLVTRCLAKDRAARPQTYAALEKALRPFSSVAPVPAGLGRRFAAGLADQAVFAAVVGPISLYLALLHGQDAAARFGPFRTLVWIAYFGLLEGLWQASLGKRLLGLRVIRADGQRLGLARAFARAAAYQIPAFVGLVPLLAVGLGRWTQFATEHQLLGLATSIGDYALIALLFSTARRRNGFAAVHDRLSNTRVVRHLPPAAHGVADLPAGTPPDTSRHGGRVGPFDVAATLGTTAHGELLLGQDSRLRRQVWIHLLKPGSPSVPPVLRNLGRPGRLRWLSGRRSATETWDAYEAVDGVPLATLDRPQSWVVVRRWLHDLAVELHAGFGDGSLASLPLVLSHVWVTRDGHARLVDFPAPNAPTGDPDETASLASAQTLLASTAVKGLAGRTPAEGGTPPATLPLSARALVDALLRQELTSPADLVAETSAQMAQPDRVAPWRRTASVALCGLIVAFLGFTGFLTALVMERTAVNQPDLAALGDSLQRLSELSGDASPRAAAERDALEVYIAGRFRSRIGDESVWTNPVSIQKLKSHRALAADVVARHPSVTPGELAAATASLGPFIALQAKATEDQQRMARKARLTATGAMLILGLALEATFGTVFAFFLRGGVFLRAFGLAVVDRNGHRASRVRAAWRALVAWAPAGVLATIVLNYGVLIDTPSSSKHPVLTAAAIVAALVFIGGGALAALRPALALQDRAAGTSIVPV